MHISRKLKDRNHIAQETNAKVLDRQGVQSRDPERTLIPSNQWNPAIHDITQTRYARSKYDHQPINARIPNAPRAPSSCKEKRSLRQERHRNQPYAYQSNTKIQYPRNPTPSPPPPTPPPPRSPHNILRLYLNALNLPSIFPRCRHQSKIPSPRWSSFMDHGRPGPIPQFCGVCGIADIEVRLRKAKRFAKQLS